MALLIIIAERCCDYCVFSVLFVVIIAEIVWVGAEKIARSSSENDLNRGLRSEKPFQSCYVSSHRLSVTFSIISSMWTMIWISRRTLMISRSRYLFLEMPKVTWKLIIWPCVVEWPNWHVNRSWNDFTYYQRSQRAAKNNNQGLFYPWATKHTFADPLKKKVNRWVWVLIVRHGPET